MNDPPPVKRGRKEPGLAGRIATQADRKLKAANNSGRGVWHGLGMMGLIGWSVVVPTLLGAAAGAWLDARHPEGRSWTLALLAAGLTLGCLNAWHWISREGKAMHEDESDE